MGNRLKISDISHASEAILMDLTIEALKALGRPASRKEIFEKVAEIDELSEEELAIQTKHEDPQSKFTFHCGFALTILKHGGALNNPKQGIWELTEEGRKMSGLDTMTEIRKEYLETLEEKRKAKSEESEIQSSGISERDDFNNPTNLILYGPPGTSKTYNAITEALKICIGMDETSRLEETGRHAVVKKYKDLLKRKRIVFVTFHQSFSYEEFVEGLRPTTENEGSDSSKTQGGFTLKPNEGIFQKICNQARKEYLTGKLEHSRTVYQIGVNYSWSPSDSIQKCLDNSVIQNEWAPDADWSDSKAKSLEDFKSEWEGKVDEDLKTNTGGMRQVYDFRFKMKEGDYVVLADGQEKFVAVGQVEGPYFYNSSESHAPHTRKVNWLWKDPEGRDRSDIYSVKFVHHATYELEGGKINWDSLDRLIYGESDAIVDNALPNYVLIIDEINRANISKVFGELITLLEPDKRIGAENEIQVRLPYSGDQFGVPMNLHIIGTMNTADRSIALLDTALRRRFKFKELMPDPSKVPDLNLGNCRLPALFSRINDRIEYLHDREHQIGHAYFMKCQTLDDVKDVFRNSVIPLLAEYFYEDRSKIAKVLGDYRDETSPLEGCFFDAKRLDPGQLGLEDGDSDSESTLRWTIRDEFDFEELKVS